jgi:chromosome segregation ATPase
MLRHLFSACLTVSLAGVVSAAQSSSSSASQQSQPPAQSSSSTALAAASAAESKDQPADKNSAKDKKKPKKVWTEDDISKVGGSISVVGNPSDANSSNSAKSSARSEGAHVASARNNEIENYREQLRQLQAQLDATDRKIEELRNFKGNNSSPSGGINPDRGYTMTPIGDQIKQLEDKKKQIQDKIDAVTDEARKKGIEPGDLR